MTKKFNNNKATAKKRKQDEHSKQQFLERDKKRQKKTREEEQAKQAVHQESFLHRTSIVSGSADKYEIMSQQMREIQRLRNQRTQTEEEDEAEEFGDDESYIVRDASTLPDDRLVQTTEHELSILDQVLAQEEKQQQKQQTATTTTTKNKKQVTNKIALHCDYVGTGEYGVDEKLAQVCLVNESGECIYLQQIEIFEDSTNDKSIVDYRTKETGLSQKAFAKGNTKKLNVVRKEIMNKLGYELNTQAKKVLIGHNLSKHIKYLFGTYNVMFLRDIARYHPVYKSALPREGKDLNEIMSKNSNIPDNLPVEDLKAMSSKYLGITDLVDPVSKTQCIMRIYKNFEGDFDAFFSKNTQVLKNTSFEEYEQPKTQKEKKRIAQQKRQDNAFTKEIGHRMNVRQQLDNTIDSLLHQLKNN
jgi:hypothetical protein